MVALAPKARDSFPLSMDFAGVLRLFLVFLALPGEPPLLSGPPLKPVSEVAGANQLSPSLLEDDPSGRRLHLLSGEFAFRPEEGEIRRNRSRATH